jgi:UDP-N-acetylglucosamine diphosphorylase / glucose-1-phosphate thymidylyltransferase / UDP-N-acetylgalactosamine diphosphorylase / glucosamine-1-phosphate N-acetyltransferase / galactosamine-1-phosphate N-acetyltransferase
MVMSTTTTTNLDDTRNIDNKPKNIGIIMAAGRGSRMKPLTDTQPKPLAKYKNDRTLIEINLDRILPLVDEVVIVLHYLGQQIEDFVGYNYKGKKVSYTWSESPTTGTLDAFRQGIYSNSKFKNCNFVVTNSDNICGIEYYTKLQKQIQSNPDITCLLATKIKDQEILKSSGVFVIDKDSNLIKIVEKSNDIISNLVNIGIYYLPQLSFEYVSSQRPKGDSEEYITDLFNQINATKTIKIISSQDSYLPISTVSDLEL